MCIHGPISHCVQGYTQIRQRWCHWDINMPKRKWQYRFVRYVHCTDTVHKSGTAANKNKTEPYGFHTQHMAIHQMEEKRRKRMKSVKWNEFQWTDIHSITHFQCPLESLKLEEHREFNQIQAMEYLAYIFCILNISIKKCLITIHFQSLILFPLQIPTIQIVLMTYQKVFTNTHRPIHICSLCLFSLFNWCICFYPFLCMKKTSHFFVLFYVSKKSFIIRIFHVFLFSNKS